MNWKLVENTDWEEIADFLKLFNAGGIPKINLFKNGMMKAVPELKNYARNLEQTELLLGGQDINKVKSGDILIAVMTFPNFIPAMEKAAAFVTDEGGILCYAAIVAREMKKPCMIGTKIATKIFKDGDMVEVDANLGSVKKI